VVERYASQDGHRHGRQSSAAFGLNRFGSSHIIGLIMQIIFPKQSAIDPDTMGVAFPVEVDGVRRRVLISTEALEDHFGGDHNPDKKSVLRPIDTSLRRRLVKSLRVVRKAMCCCGPQCFDL